MAELLLQFEKQMSPAEEHCRLLLQHQGEFVLMIYSTSAVNQKHWHIFLQKCTEKCRQRVGVMTEKSEIQLLLEMRAAG